MGLALLVAAAVVAFTVRGIYKTGAARVAAHGIHNLVYRWLTGHPWHGKPVTDAGWFRPGRRALTVTGHAPRFHFRPRWQRTVMRSGSTLLLAAILWSWFINQRVTQWVVLCICIVFTVYGGWRAYRAWHGRKHRRTWVEPLHVVCAPLVGIPVANPPRSWLAIEPDRSKAVLSLPPGTDFSDPKAQEQLARAVTAKLGLEAPDVSWRLGGPEPTLTVRRSEPPPDKVLLADVRKYIDEAGTEVLVLGLGKGSGNAVTISLHGDSPHVGLSMGSGGGKSATAAVLPRADALQGRDRPGAGPQAHQPRVGAGPAERRLRPRRRRSCTTRCCGWPPRWTGATGSPTWPPTSRAT